MRISTRNYSDFLSLVAQICGTYRVFYFELVPADNSDAWVISDDGNVVIKYTATGSLGLPGTFAADFPNALQLNERPGFPASM